MFFTIYLQPMYYRRMFLLFEITNHLDLYTFLLPTKSDSDIIELLQAFSLVHLDSHRIFLIIVSW